MFRKPILCLLLAALCVAGSLGMAAASEVACDSVYCFDQKDFSHKEEDIEGICITGLPDPATGTVMLGTRVLQTGDILTAQQVDEMTFVPLATEKDREAVVTYLPIYADRVEAAVSMTIRVRGKVDQAPVAVDQALETYKNLENSGTLKVHDPEGQALTYTVTRQPRRGTVTIREDGTFTYTPKKNRSGTDSFTYTATDPGGNVSREATVTVTVLKPADKLQYSDTLSFEAEWMRHNGIFTGEQVNGRLMFCPEKTVSRGEFLAMAVKVLGIPVDEELTTGAYTDEIPRWLQPYVAAALRSGLTADLEGTTFGAAEPITGEMAAVMLQNALDLSVSAGALESGDPVTVAVAALAENGIAVSVQDTLTRAQAAKLLYGISRLAETAPGLQMYR